MRGHSYGMDILGASNNVPLMRHELIGIFDIAAKQQDMNHLKAVTVGIAQSLLRGGQQAINHARDISLQKSLPGTTARDNVYWKLQWHADQLKKAAASTALYPPGDDLKKWVMQAFIESNAADEGAAYIDQIWSQMWIEIEQQIAALPKEVVKKLEDAAAGVESVSKWLVAGTVVLGGALIYGAYKLLSGPAGQAVVRRYLP